VKNWGKVIQIADHVVNLLIIIFFLPILLYGIYAIFDSNRIYQQADASLYETYKPSKDKLLFEELQKINLEVFGWLTIENTHIDYPLVQASNNSKYVNTDVKGEFSLSGSIFLDCRNEKNFSDMNNVIYGHNMAKKTMFGEIELFDDTEYFETHQYGELYFEGLWHEIELFAFLYADAYDSLLYNTKLQGEADHQQYLNYIRENARNFKELPFGTEEHFVTLSTCNSTSTNGRQILVGRISEKTRRDIE